MYAANWAANGALVFLRQAYVLLRVIGDCAGRETDRGGNQSYLSLEVHPGRTGNVIGR